MAAMGPSMDFLNLGILFSQRAQETQCARMKNGKALTRFLTQMASNSACAEDTKMKMMDHGEVKSQDHPLVVLVRFHPCVSHILFKLC